MSLTLYMHPLASFCQKALIAFYENDTPFEPRIVDLGDETSRAEFLKIWPIGRMPVLRDEARDRTIPESSIIIEYLAQHYPGKMQLVPTDVDLARQTRFRDRFYDLYVQEPMQKIVTDRLRPTGKNDPHGVEQAKGLLQAAYGMIEHDMSTKTWAMGNAFSMADCAAAPALFYADLVRRHVPEHRGVPAAPDGTPFLRPGGQGSGTVPGAVPEGELEASTEGPSMAGDGKIAKYKDVIELKSDDHRVLASHLLRDGGTWQQSMTAHCRRNK